MAWQSIAIMLAKGDKMTEMQKVTKHNSPQLLPLDLYELTDRITSDRKRHWVHTEEISLYPERIRHWPRICTRERWQAYITATEE